MAFAQLQASLRQRKNRLAGEFASGDRLETVLDRHLLAVETAAETDMLTSILLLDDNGRRLWHGAAPSLSREYCEAIDGIEIGPTVGSCGTAAYLGQAVYVTDIAADPLWKDYRDLAAQHGLQACWSTPIRDGNGALLGTFAIYHLTPRSPTADEVAAISLITAHVAEAIVWSHVWQVARRPDHELEIPGRGRVKLRLVENHPDVIPEDQEASTFEERFQAYAVKLEQFAGMVSSSELTEALKGVAIDCRNLAAGFRDASKPPSDD